MEHKDLFYVAGFVVLYLALNRWVLPKFGVKT
jgi:hypothetical protein